MGTRWPPVKDADFNSMVVNASTKISLAPTSYGLDAGKATALASAVSAWSAAYAAVLDPATRTKMSISIKDDKRAFLTQILRDYNKLVQGTPTVTDAQKIDIGFPVYKSRSPIPPPAEPPVVTIASQGPWRMKLHLRQADATRRGFPAGVKTAWVFTYQGPLPLPTDVAGWAFQGSSSKPDFDVALDPSIPAGSLIYITACWLNPRQMASTLAAPISTNVVGGVGGGTNAEGSMQIAA